MSRVVERTTVAVDEMPAPSAELVVLRTGAQALVRALGRRKGERFLREWAQLLADEESVRLLFPTRPAADRAAVSVAQRQAVAWLRQTMPVLIATLPPE